MREKIILQDFTVLLVCTSQKWSTVERRVLFDSTFLRNIGCNPIIFCQKGSQLDKAAESEDIPRFYIKKKKLDFYLGIQFLFELRSLIQEKRFDIVHCYTLSSAWVTSFILQWDQKIPFFFTLNQNVNSFYQNLFAKWLLRRVDYIFTLSDEIKEFVEETFPVHSRKIVTLGGGLEVLKKAARKEEVQTLGCIINDLNELKRLRYVIRTFRVLKKSHADTLGALELNIFLGPRIYQKDRFKKFLTEFDYEFYEGDIFLLSLEEKSYLLKNLDVFWGTAFDEPLNDYEIVCIMNEIPVLFPRTSMRQNLLFRLPWVGESYYQGDIREAKTKLEKIINNYNVYRSSLADSSEKIQQYHGLDYYAEQLQRFYEKAFSKRRIAADK
ncbi:MAG: glycosyltransferase [Bacteriovoracaceae bacterium]|jgi:hypothetical protein|nr:hypothetical protein [Halobacteriovoraceae bacterium]MDP7320212.1 glycosyltransferase [Bacteriovoracaceae bacterium]